MIRPEQVFLLVDPVDMRWGMQRLSLQVQQILGRFLGGLPRQREGCALVDKTAARLLPTGYTAATTHAATLLPLTATFGDG